MSEGLKTRLDHRKGLRRVLPREGLFRFSFAYFLAANILLLVTAPLLDKYEHGVLIEAACISFVMLSALLAIGGTRGRLMTGLMLAIPAIVGQWLNFWWPDWVAPEVSLGFGILFMIFIVLNILRYVLQAPKVSSEILCAAISCYLMLGFLWAFAYVLVGAAVPDAFAFSTGPESTHFMKGFNCYYFSFATLSTIGYGDIAPVAGGARMLAITEAIVGMFYVTMLIARLVSLYSSEELSGS